MEKKIIFFDIDGTILDEDTGTIPSSTLDAIHQAKANGHLCVINSGRPITAIDEFIKDVGFDGYVCGCGTNIYIHNKEILHYLIDEDTRRKIIRLAYECDVDCMLEGKNGTYFKEIIRHPFVKQIQDLYTRNHILNGEYKDNSDCHYDKFTVWYDELSDIEKFKNAIQNEFTIIQRAPDFIEVVPLGYSKASGIQSLIDYLNMGIDQTISIGDSTNDLSMLEYTKESIAMGNSNPVLFDYVTYITTDIKEDGIKNALKHFHII